MQQPPPPVVVDAGAPALDAAPPAFDAAPATRPGMTNDEDAGPDVTAAPSCTDGQWVLAPGFLLSERVDYVEDRNDQIWPYTMSSAGTPCATARDKVLCMESLKVETMFLGRHLLATAGDKVRVWNGASAFQLLGLIDTPSEAMWVAQVQGMQVTCGIGEVRKHADGFLVDGVVKPFYGCEPPDGGLSYGTVLVYSDTSVVPQWSFDENPKCPMTLPPTLP